MMISRQEKNSRCKRLFFIRYLYPQSGKAQQGIIVYTIGQMAFSDPTSNIEQFSLQYGMRVADFGAGSGFYSLAAARAVGPHGHVYSIDVQKDILSKIKNDSIKAGLSNIEIHWGDIERLGGSKLKDSSIDAVIMSNVLFQMPDKQTPVLEAKRILHPKTGKILVVDWNDSSGGVGPQGEHLFPQDKARDLFEKAGFAFDSSISAGDHHYGLIFKMK